MQPQIRYAESFDGVRIAYSLIGSGPPLVIMPVLPATHLEMDWQLPDRKEWYLRLGQSFSVIRYDGRGSGLSEREVPDLSFEAHLADLNAVVERAGAERFSVLARHIAGPLALTQAARHPESVDRLILWNSFARLSDFMNTRRTQALLSLVEKDWELFTETIAYAGQGWPETGRARQFAAYMRTAISQSNYRDYLLEFGKVDCGHLLARVTCPTLVFHRKDVAKFDVSVSKSLVASLPNARLVLAEGRSSALFGEDLENVTETIEDFLNEPGPVRHAHSGGVVPVPCALTVRETEVLGLLSAGKHNKEIAAQLGVSVHTIDRHLANIFNKIGAHNRVEAAAFALTHGLGLPAASA